MAYFMKRLHRFAVIFLAPLCAGLLAAACTAHSSSGHADSEVTEIDGSKKDKAIAAGSSASAPAPTAAGHLRIMSYNVLRYGCECLGSNETAHGYLRTVVRYANPDVLGMVKVNAIKQHAGDKDKYAPIGFADSILNRGPNAVFPNRYAVCPFTNKAEANNVNLLFYDKQKLAYAGMETLATDETDFNLFKLYLTASVANGSKDTTFLYFILNHTESGDKAKKRNRQIDAVMAALHQRFKTLPNLIDMGDFNLRNTTEDGYQGLTNSLDANFRFADPPFALDKALQYPADWENEPGKYAAYLTTSTRKNAGEPNDCGTSGGAKFWFDHIFLSPLIAQGKAGLSYVPHTFKVIGNDGQREGRSITSDKHPNTSAPADVIDALYQLSNKYPVMLELQGR